MVMKAAVCRAFGNPLSIEDVVLAPPGPGELTVTVEACSICHSDLAFIDGAWNARLPAVFGHEAAGTVAAVGDSLSDIAVGDRVIVTLIRSCGGCPSCRSGSVVTCSAEFSLDQRSPLQSLDGEAISQGMRTGAFAEQVTVDKSQVVRIDKNLPVDVASLLACGVLTGYCAVTRSAKMPDEAHVVVIGAGGVGLNSVQGAPPVAEIRTMA